METNGRGYCLTQSSLSGNGINAVAEAEVIFNNRERNEIHERDVRSSFTDLHQRRSVLFVSCKQTLGHSDEPMEPLLNER